MPERTLPSYTQVARILQQALGQEEGLLVMEFFLSHLPSDVARQRDVAEVRLEVEQVRAALTKEIEQMRAELRLEIEQVRKELRLEIEQVRREIAEIKASLIRWAFGFWLSQMVVLAGILFHLLR